MENYTQLCVWPNTLLGDSTPEEFEQYMLDELKVRIKFVKQVFTKPTQNVDGSEVEGTGGRSDLFFFIHDDDIPQFVFPKLGLGISWWEDIVSNGYSYLYDEDFVKEHPTTW